MNALADEVLKKGQSHSDMHSITWSHYSTTIIFPGDKIAV